MQAQTLDTPAALHVVHADTMDIAFTGTYEACGKFLAAKGFPAELRGPVTDEQRQAFIAAARTTAAALLVQSVGSAVLTAAIVGYDDTADADMVVLGDDGGPDVSFYTDADYAANMAEYLGATDVDHRLVDLTGMYLTIEPGDAPTEGDRLLCHDGVPLDWRELDALLGIVGWATRTTASAEAARATVAPAIAEAFGLRGSPVVTVHDGGHRTVAPASNSAVAEARIIEDDTVLLRELGLARPSGNYATNPLAKTAGGYKPGTTVIDLGYENLRTARRDWESMPFTEDACTTIIEAIRAEGRRDVTVRVGDLSVTDAGVFLVNGEATPMEPHAYSTLLARISGTHAAGTGPLFPSAARYLMQLPPDERAWNLRKGLARANSNDNLVFRMHQVWGDEQALAVVSDGYEAYDADKVADAIRTLVMGKGYRGEAGYEAGSTNLNVEATYHVDAKKLVDFAAGDVTQLGYRFRSNDAGGGSINGGSMGRWNGCLNYIVIEEGAGSTFRVIHRGNVAALVGDMMKGLTRMQPVFDRFAKRWGVLRGKPIRSVKLWGSAFTTGRDALSYIVKEGKLDDVGVSGDKLTKFLHDAWEREAITSGPDDSLARVMAAITRAAHESLVDDCRRDTWERRAGVLVPVLANFAAVAEA